VNAPSRTHTAFDQWTGAGLELVALFVTPARIGTGMGRRLMAHAVEAARERGAARIVIQGDPNVAPFYLAGGAERIGERESCSIPGRCLPLFEIRPRA